MIKQYFNIIIAVVSLALVTSCDYDEQVFEPDYVTFEGLGLTSGDNSIALSVQENSSSTRDITVYTGNKVGTDRSYNIIVAESSTLTGSVYDVPGSVTVPANSNEVTFTVNLADEGLPNAGGTLVLMLEETGAYSTGDPLILNVSKVCPFDISRFVGTFDASEVFTAGGNEGFSFLEGASFPIDLALNPDDASGNSLVLSDSNGIITDGTILTFDPATGAFTVPEGTMVAGYPLVFTGSTTDTCNEKLTFTGNLNETADSAGFGQYTVTLQKQ